jgi:hypothetical protein
METRELRMLRDLYGSTERVLGVYRKPGSEKINYYALNPDTPMPEQHPTDRDYRLTGILNPRTGAIAVPGQSEGHAEATVPRTGVFWSLARGLWWMVATAFAVVAWVSIFALFAQTGRGGGGRGRLRW